MQLDTALRDELAKLAARDFHGVPLGEAVSRLITEHKINRVIQRYEELRSNAEEWADYQADIGEFRRSSQRRVIRGPTLGAASLARGGCRSESCVAGR